MVMGAASGVSVAVMPAACVGAVGAAAHKAFGLGIEALFAARAAQVVRDALVDGRWRRSGIDRLRADGTLEHGHLLACVFPSRLIRQAGGALGGG